MLPWQTMCNHLQKIFQYPEMLIYCKEDSCYRTKIDQLLHSFIGFFYVNPAENNQMSNQI